MKTDLTEREWAKQQQQQQHEIDETEKLWDKIDQIISRQKIQRQQNNNIMREEELEIAIKVRTQTEHILHV